MKLPQLSLTTKIANYFLLLALITVGIVGGVTYFRAREALKQAAFDRLNVAATLKEEEITRWFEDQQRDFLLTTQMPDIQANLDILLNSSLSQEKQQAYKVLFAYLTKVTQIKPSFREIFILDRSNKIILSSNQEREGNYEILANITYIKQVEIGTNFAPIFYVSPLTGKPAITLAKPLEDRQGMILVDLDLERIDRIVRQKTGLGVTGETYLVGSLISQNTFLAGNWQSTQAFPDGVNSAGIDAAMSGMSGYGLYRNYAKSPVLGVYRWLNEQDIALLVEINQKEAFEPASKLASDIVTVGLMSVLGLLVGVNWLSRQLYFSRQQLEESSRQLQLKAQEAEAANHAKSLFLANMSHELRTPLNVILGFSQLLARDTAATSQQKESLDIINRSGEHLLNLINDVLAMSKIEAGKVILNCEPFDLHQLLQSIREMFLFKTNTKKLWFRFILADNLPQWVVGDTSKLRQLLINLLGNAVKFTQTGGVTLRAFISKSEEFSETTQLCFEVSDTGKGIAPEELDKLFDPFVQTASGIQSEGGTGLGLSISRQFVELMGGKIKVTSILGKGSTFAFDLKVKLADSSQVPVLSKSQQIKQRALGHLYYRIAVVDDQETNRLVLVKLLQSVGFEPRTANNGVEAIALWQEWQPNLIWMDIRMPVMDGFEATRKIKSQPQGKKTIIIAITASVFEEQREQILKAGCDDFVGKPFTENIIFDKLTQHLGVKYIYKSESSNISTESSNNATQLFSAQDLSSLSPALITELNQAAIAVDAEQLEKLITHIPDSHQHIARAIAEMIHNYDFDGIIDLTESGSNLIS
jgi:signal transduction histidine kinase/DNA-binding response OmpR family regulator